MLGKIFFYVSPNRDFEKIFLPSFGDFGGGGGEELTVLLAPDCHLLVYVF